MEERLYEVWGRFGENQFMVASHMTLAHALVLVEAWIEYLHEGIGLEIRQMRNVGEQ